MQQHIDSYDFKGKKAIVRVDFNVPLDGLKTSVSMQRKRVSREDLPRMLPTKRRRKPRKL